MAKVQKKNDEDDIIVNEEVEDVETNEALDFFDSLTGCDERFSLTLNKFGDGIKERPNKKYYVKKWYDYKDFDIEKDIQEIYGGGRYQLVLKYRDSKTGKNIFKTAELNILDIPKNEIRSLNPSRTEILSELVQMKSIIGGESGGQNNDIILKFMEMTSTAQKEMFERMMMMQNSSEKRISEVLERISEKRDLAVDPISSMQKTIEFVDTLRGDRTPEDSGGLSNLMENPIVKQALPYIISQFDNKNKTPEKSQVNQKPIEVDIDECIRNMPQTFKDSITPENKETKIQTLYEGNKKVLTRENARIIIEKIMEVKK